MRKKIKIIEIKKTHFSHMQQIEKNVKITLVAAHSFAIYKLFHRLLKLFCKSCLNEFFKIVNCQDTYRDILHIPIFQSCLTYQNAKTKNH